MVNLVLDTNIYISAFLFSGAVREVLEIVIENKVNTYISDDILDEIKTVLGRKKFSLKESRIDAIISEIRSVTHKVFPDREIHDICRDQNDHIILECAVKSHADYIITGDQDLLVLELYKGIKIKSSSAFLAIKK